MNMHLLTGNRCLTVALGLSLLAVCNTSAQQSSSRPNNSSYGGGFNRGGSAASSAGASSQYNANGAVGNATISIDPDTHNVTILADEESTTHIAEVITNLDRPQPQVQGTDGEHHGRTGERQGIEQANPVERGQPQVRCPVHRQPIHLAHAEMGVPRQLRPERRVPDVSGVASGVPVDTHGPQGRRGLPSHQQGYGRDDPHSDRLRSARRLEKAPRQASEGMEEARHVGGECPIQGHG